MVGYIILVLVVIVLAIALFTQAKAAKKQSADGQKLLEDYQRRVNEMEKLLSDYRSLEQNFDNVGQGYEQALLAFDKVEEERQKMQSLIDKLQKENEQLQHSRTQISGSLLQKKEVIEQAALEAKKQILANPATVIRQLNDILNANDIDMETAIEADDNVLVSEIIDKAVNESGIKAANYLTFSTEAEGDVKATMLLTSEANLVRALAALLDNAAKFTTDGDVKLIVRPEGSQLKFIVEDAGTGIAAEDAGKIFEPFVKLNNYFDGAGIGLTAARSIARRLNGDLTLDTTFAGPGARFVLTTPF